MADRTIFIEYGEGDALTNAFSVTLSSEDGTYGIKAFDSEVVIAADGTIPDNPSTGRYEYTFDTVPGEIYLVSWEIIPNVGNTPIYQEEQIGPFQDITNDGIRAVADKKGTYKPGSTAFLFLKVTTIDGIPINASNVNIIIRDSNGSTVTTGDPDKPTDGFYVYEWDIDEDQTNGDYNVSWEYTIDNVTYYEAQEVIVAEDIDLVSSTYNPNMIATREALSYYISCAQHIPAYFEQAKPTFDMSTYRFTFPRWNQSTGVKIYRNNNMVEDGIEIDYFKGEVKFDTPLTQYDMVHADYNFRWFSDEELTRFLENALGDLNTYPPHTAYDFYGNTVVPDRFLPSVIRKAAADAIRKLMMCLQFQEPQQVFGGAEGAQKAFSNFETLKKNYEADWQKTAENKKLGPYPRTMIISTPEYTLPGGRSRWFRYLFK
jgi:hypothetical protein